MYGVRDVDSLAFAYRFATVEGFHDREFVPIAFQQLGEL